MQIDALQLQVEKLKLDLNEDVADVEVATMCKPVMEAVATLITERNDEEELRSALHQERRRTQAQAGSLSELRREVRERATGTTPSLFVPFFSSSSSYSSSYS